MTSPGPEDLLVRICAAGLNRADVLRWRGPGSAAPGIELAGEVLEVGSAVTGWSAGDRMMSLGPGFASEPVTIPARLAMPVPASMSWEEAGALPAAVMTMHDAIVTNGHLEPGERVLVQAATSGVGIAAVQMAARLGASVVYATSRSTEKLAVLAAHLGDLPCDVVGIDTTATAFESVARDVELIVDNVGASVLAGNIAAAALAGRIIQVGRLGGVTAEIDLDELARKRIALIGVTFRTRTADEVAAVVARTIAGLGPGIEAIRPRIERVYPHDRVDDALQDLGKNEHVGKLVVLGPT